MNHWTDGLHWKGHFMDNSERVTSIELFVTCIFFRLYSLHDSVSYNKVSYSLHHVYVHFAAYKWFNIWKVYGTLQNCPRRCWWCISPTGPLMGLRQSFLNSSDRIFEKPCGNSKTEYLQYTQMLCTAFFERGIILHMSCTGSVVTRTVRFIVNLFLLDHYFNIQIPYFVFQ